MFLTAALTCAILGDSIAVGIAQHRPECRRIAQVGITSQNWNRRHNIRIEANEVIISLGTNDGNGPTEASVRAIRSRIHARRVTWVLPAMTAGHTHTTRVQAAIRQTASINGDRVVRIPSLARDGIHPANYRVLANLTR